MKNGDFPMKNGKFSIVMLNYQRVSFKSGDAEDVSDPFFFLLETMIAVSDMLFSDTNLRGLSPPFLEVIYVPSKSSCFFRDFMGV